MEQKHGFALDIRQSSGNQRVIIDDRLSIGRAADNDFIIDDVQISPHQCIFKVQNGILSVHYLGGTSTFQLGTQVLEAGKMYIIDHGDKLTLADVEFIIRKEDESQEIIPDELKSIFAAETQSNIDIKANSEQIEDDKTDPNISPAQLDELDEEIEIDEEDIEIEETGSQKKPQFDMASDLEEDFEYDEDFTEPKRKWWQIFSKKKPEYEIIEPEINEDDFEDDLEDEIEEEVKSKKATKKKPEKLTGPSPSFLARVAAFLGQLGLSLTIFTLVGNELILTDIVNMLPKDILKAVPSPLVKLILIYIGTDLVSHIILGTNIGLFLMGVKQNGSFITIRLKAILRSLIAVLTIPTLLLELPLLFGKRSIKEVLTGTHLQKRSKILEFVGTLVIAPVLILSPVALPLFLEADSFVSKNFISKTLKRPKKRGETVFNTYSESLGLRFKGQIDQSKELILPKVLLNNKKSIKIIFLDRVKQKKVEIKKVQPPPFINWLVWAQKGNPLFNIYFPALTDYYKELSLGKKPKLGEKGLLELKSLLQNSLSLSNDNLLDVALSQGPFLYGLIELQKQLAATLQTSPDKMSIGLFDQGKHLILYSQSTTNKKVQEDQLYIIGNSSFERYLLAYDRKDKQMSRKFLKDYLPGLTPLNSKRLPKKATFDAFRIVDIYDELQSNHKYELTDDLIANIYEYYMAQARAVANIESKDNRDKKLLIKTLKRSRRYLKTVNKSRKHILIIELESGLKKIQKALQADNKDFFK